MLQVVLAPDRAPLADAIAARTRQMFQDGLVEEVRTLLGQGLSGQEKPFESLGYKQVVAHLRGEMSLEQAMAATEIETRQYAKRQLTWFRGASKGGSSKNDARILWFAGFGSDPPVEPEVLEAVRKFLSA